jgi:hypothetical protein
MKRSDKDYIRRDRIVIKIELFESYQKMETTVNRRECIEYICISYHIIYEVDFEISYKMLFFKKQNMIARTSMQLWGSIRYQYLTAPIIPLTLFPARNKMIRVIIGQVMQTTWFAILWSSGTPSIAYFKAERIIPLWLRQPLVENECAHWKRNGLLESENLKLINWNE